MTLPIKLCNLLLTPSMRSYGTSRSGSRSPLFVFKVSRRLFRFNPRPASPIKPTRTSSPGISYVNASLQACSRSLPWRMIRANITRQRPCSPRPGNPVRIMTVREQLESLAAHNAYHFGRIVLLRQLRQAWPFPLRERLFSLVTRSAKIFWENALPRRKIIDEIGFAFGAIDNNGNVTIADRPAWYPDFLREATTSHVLKPAALSRSRAKTSMVVDRVPSAPGQRSGAQ